MCPLPPTADSFVIFIIILLLRCDRFSNVIFGEQRHNELRFNPWNNCTVCTFDVVYEPTITVDPSTVLSVNSIFTSVVFYADFTALKTLVRRSIDRFIQPYMDSSRRRRCETIASLVHIESTAGRYEHVYTGVEHRQPYEWMWIMSPARTRFKAFFSDDGRFRIDAQDRVFIDFFGFFFFYLFVFRQPTYYH